MTEIMKAPSRETTMTAVAQAASSLVGELDERSSQIRFDVIDFSAGELIRLHHDKEINIQPAFQRMFRWTQAQQSRLIESMLLGLPVPQIVLFQKGGRRLGAYRWIAACQLDH